MRRTNLLIAAASTIVALLAAELALRLFLPQIGWVQRMDPVVGWSSDEYQRFDATTLAHPGRPRILFLGDSFLAGSGVSRLDRRFPVRLQSALGDQVTIRTFASGGWGTDQQLLALREKGQAFRADHVVLAFCANNDISNILSHNHGPLRLKPYYVLRDDGRLELFDGLGQPFDDAMARRAGTSRAASRRYRSHLFDLAGIVARSFASPVERSYRHVDRRYREYRYREHKHSEIYRRQTRLSWSPQTAISNVSAYIDGSFPNNRYQWELFESILGELKAEVERSAGTLSVLLLPVIYNPEDSGTIAGGTFRMRFQTPAGSFQFSSAVPRERLRGISERVGVGFVDPTAEFIARVAQGGLMGDVWPDPGDRHFSDLGHEIVAELLRDDIEAMIRDARERRGQGGRSAGDLSQR